MPVFVVQSASHKKDVDGKYGAMQVIALNLKAVDSDQVTSADWFTKKSTPIPVAGAQLEGELSQTDYGWSFKKAQNPMGGFGGGGPRPEDPKKAAAIQRMHSQTAAVTLIAAKAQAGLATADDFKPGKIAALADWFDQDADAKREAA